MPPWLATVSLHRVELLATSYAVTGALLLVLLVPLRGVVAPWRRWSLWLLGAAAAGAVAGWLLVYWVSDVADLFGVGLSDVVFGAGTVMGAALAVVVVNLVRVQWWRRLVAIAALPAVLVSTGLVINEDVAYYPTVGALVGPSETRPLALGTGRASDVALSDWRPSGVLPMHGTVGSVRIPSTESHFVARNALVYLPPAARASHPPRLPVVIAMSGQPGVPNDVFGPGGLARTMDAIAARHRGVAPIVVAPDQLGPSERNTLCIDSPLGDVATYITVDVRRWIVERLPVSLNRHDWTVTGFSQGGTCAVQFAAGYPAVFGSFVDVSGEADLRAGTVRATIRTVFRGDRGAYLRAQPIALLRAHRHYSRTRALFVVGADDVSYAADAPRLAAEARRVGMRTALWTIPGAGHDWNTATRGFAWGMGRLETWWGLP